MQRLLLLVTLGLLSLLLLGASDGRAPDRHAEFTDPAQQLDIAMPDWPGAYPVPAHLRQTETHYIVIENWQDGRIRAVWRADQGEITGAESSLNEELIGSVLAPVANINKRGFTGSGWAEPGEVTATAVNAIHLKVNHDYESGRAAIFSLLPIDFADFDPTDYKSYFNQSSSLFTDIKGGYGIFGGSWAPLSGSAFYAHHDPDGQLGWWQAPRVEAGYVPQVGDVLVIKVGRLSYNPEYIEFENGYGGLIWIKEVGMERYPIGQVLKPVAGVGRFLGTQFAAVGRIRAAHPGVIDISTAPYDVIGGFQIIPRDHAMSQEMFFTRVKTQWMVVGPLWALDPSWEGLPPLFSDYLYPAFTPALNPDGSVNEDATGASVFLDRFTVRARYSDAEDPEEWELIREEVYLDNDALQHMTSLRLYFPRT